MPQTSASASTIAGHQLTRTRCWKYMPPLEPANSPGLVPPHPTPNGHLSQVVRPSCRRTFYTKFALTNKCAPLAISSPADISMQTGTNFRNKASFEFLRNKVIESRPNSKRVMSMYKCHLASQGSKIRLCVVEKTNGLFFKQNDCVYINYDFFIQHSRSMTSLKP